MGGDNRPLFTEDPSKSTHLPVDDGAWDRGVSPISSSSILGFLQADNLQESVVLDRLFVSSSTELSASPFARVAQATHLLGKVIRHCNDEVKDLSDVQGYIELLYQAITSLLGLLAKDTQSIVQFQNAIAICLRLVASRASSTRL